MPVSRQRLLDLEKLDAIPPTYMRRIAAYLAVVVYGFDPADFELDVSCLPSGWDVEEVVAEVRESVKRLQAETLGVARQAPVKMNRDRSMSEALSEAA